MVGIEVRPVIGAGMVAMSANPDPNRTLTVTAARASSGGTE